MYVFIVASILTLALFGNLCPDKNPSFLILNTDKRSINLRSKGTCYFFEILSVGSGHCLLSIICIKRGKSIP